MSTKPRSLKRMVRHAIIAPWAFVWLALLPLCMIGALLRLCAELDDFNDRIIKAICDKLSPHFERHLSWAKMREPNTKVSDVPKDERKPQ